MESPYPKRFCLACELSVALAMIRRTQRQIRRLDPTGVQLLRSQAIFATTACIDRDNRIVATIAVLRWLQNSHTNTVASKLPVRDRPGSSPVRAERVDGWTSAPDAFSHDVREWPEHVLGLSSVRGFSSDDEVLAPRVLG